jgi:hypothetical protein
MVEVPLDLDPAMVDNMRRESEDHGFDDLDAYVQWVLKHREAVLNEHDVWEDSGVPDPDADLSQSSSGTGLDAGGGADMFESKVPEDDGDGDESGTEDDEEDVELPEEEENSADDDDVAAALEDIELDDEE